MDDTISRQEAIKAIEAYFGDLPIKGHYDMLQLIKQLPSAQPEPEEFEWCTDCKEYDQEKHCCPRFNRVIRETVEEVRKNAEQRWIPVEERLPENEKRVLVTIPLVNGYPWVRIARYGTMMFEHKVCFYESDSEWGDCEISGVTAWMPLPKPYERSKE